MTIEQANNNARLRAEIANLKAALAAEKQKKKKEISLRQTAEQERAILLTELALHSVRVERCVQALYRRIAFVLREASVDDDIIAKAIGIAVAGLPEAK